nr:uncharacterized protein LOC116808880 [Taeniopygia guttata]
MLKSPVAPGAEPVARPPLGRTERGQRGHIAGTARARSGDSEGTERGQRGHGAGTAGARMDPRHLRLPAQQRFAHHFNDQFLLREEPVTAPRRFFRSAACWAGWSGSRRVPVSCEEPVWCCWAAMGNPCAHHASAAELGQPRPSEMPSRSPGEDLDDFISFRAAASPQSRVLPVGMISLGAPQSGWKSCEGDLPVLCNTGPGNDICSSYT